MSAMNGPNKSSTGRKLHRANTRVTRCHFIRLPRAGTKCPITGLSRTGIFLLIKSGAVKSVVLRNPGARRGARLVDYDSLIGYLRRLENEQNSLEPSADPQRKEAG